MLPVFLSVVTTVQLMLWIESNIFFSLSGSAGYGAAKHHQHHGGEGQGDDQVPMYSFL